MVVTMMKNAASLSVYNTITNTEAARIGGASTLAWLVSAVNGIWVFIEFIMILVSKDGSLQ